MRIPGSKGLLVRQDRIGAPARERAGGLKGRRRMMKKTMILADSDEAYLERLSNYFMEKSPQLELNMFTDKKLLREYVAHAHADILAVDEAFADEELAEAADASVKLSLSTGRMQIQGFEPVRKYQKTESLLNEILLKYAEATGSSEAIRGSSHTRTAAFYSPAGGTGKTVLALGLAAAAAGAGLRTLYLNLEEVDSVKYVLKKTPGSLSDLFLALKTKGMNAGIKLAASAAREPDAGFFYVSGVESIAEYEEMEPRDLARLLTTIREQAEYDAVILELSSGFSERTSKLLEQADVIFVPVTDEESAAAKVSRLLDEMELHDRYNQMIEKMLLIGNRASAKGPGRALQESGLLDRLPCGGVIGEVALFEKKASILRGGEMLRPAFQPLLDLMKGETNV